MTLDENKRLVLDHYDALFRQDADAVRKQLAEDFVDHEHPGTPPGPDAVLRAFATVRQAFPDLRVTIDDIVAEGDRVAVRATWTARHRAGVALGNLPAPATDRTGVLTGMVFWRIRDGQIVERWATLDHLGLQQQLTAKT